MEWIFVIALLAMPLVGFALLWPRLAKEIFVYEVIWLLLRAAGR